MTQDRQWLRPAILLAALLVVFVFTLPITLTPGVRARLTAALNERFDSEVDIAALRVSVLPRLRLEGDGVVLRYRGRRDVPPLITIGSFSADATLLGLLGRPLRLSRVHLDRLEINVPSDGMDLDDDEDDEEEEDHDDQESSASPSPLTIDDLLSERSVLRILRSTPGKRPRVFEIAQLSMQDAGADIPWQFEATLTNPTPPGEITTQGRFGPWNAARPAQTPLAAAYEFRHADLGELDGIQGTLHAAGAFEGVLERIEVDGRADVPEFALEDVGQAVPLTARFHATVDGTNGNTWLQPVHARLGRSAILASGGVVEREGEDDRTITLDVVMTEARIEDVLRLALKRAVPPMTGKLKLKTRFVLPPGEADPLERLRLDGSFEIATAQFTQGTLQAKMDELSRKARGDEERDEPPDRVVSDFTGEFVMRDGVIRFSNLTFAVPGARLDLAGRFAVRSEALDFRGTVHLDAKLSELTSGVKSFLLKLVDPFVRRKDVTVIPVTIKGTADDPDFGVDLGRAFTPG